MNINNINNIYFNIGIIEGKVDFLILNISNDKEKRVLEDIKGILNDIYEQALNLENIKKKEV